MESKSQGTEWVDAKLANLTPGWQPDTRQARARLRARLPLEGGPRRLPLAAGLAAALLVVAVLPATRAVGQRIWDQLFLRDVTVLRVDPNRLPMPLSIHMGQNSPVRAATVQEAAQFAGFSPVFPPDFGPAPELAVIGPISAAMNLNVEELRTALKGSGARDVRVPQEWDGVKIDIQLSPLVVASYSDDTSLMQLKPVALNAPAGFAMEELSEVAFRILGLGEREARQMAVKFTQHPTWFIAIPQDEAADIREVALQSGTGMLIRDTDEDTGLVTTSLIWSTHDRTFLLSGKITEERAIRLANLTPKP